MNHLTAALLALLAASCAFSQATAPPKHRAQKTSPSKSSAKTHPLQALLMQAEEAFAKNDFETAAVALQKYVAEKPDDAVAQFQLGYACTGLKRWDHAKAAYRRAIALDGKLAAAHLNLGLLLLDASDFRAAIDPLQMAADLMPDKAQPRFLLGTALERSGKPGDAVNQYRAALKLDASDVAIHIALGRALLNSGSPAEAEAAFRAALLIRPDAPHAHLGLAQCLIAQRKLDAAASELESHLAAQPQDAESWLQLANVLAQTGKLENALAALDRVEALTPDPAAVRLRADIYLRQKKFAEAIPLLQKALQADPQNAELHASLGRLWLEKRDFPAAERELLEALRLDAKLLDPVRDLVSVYYLGEKYEAALRMLDTLAQRETPVNFSWFIRATCYDKLSRKPEALAAYERFVELDQGRSETQDFQARQRIRILKRELKKD